MVRYIRMGICCLVLLCLAIVTSPAQAADKKSDSRWTIPFLGQMTGEETFKAIDMIEWVKELEVMLKDSDAAKQNVEPLAQNSNIQIPSGVKIYQLQFDDGKAYHIAAAIAIYDEKGSIPDLAAYFAENLGSRQAAKLADWNQRVKIGIETAQNQLSANQKVSFKVLDLKPLERVKAANEVIYGMSGRLIFSLNQAAFPLYTKVYMAERNGKAALLMIVTSDADARVWEKYSDKLVQSLRLQEIGR